MGFPPPDPQACSLLRSPSGTDVYSITQKAHRLHCNSSPFTAKECRAQHSVRTWQAAQPLDRLVCASAKPLIIWIVLYRPQGAMSAAFFTTRTKRLKSNQERSRLSWITVEGTVHCGGEDWQQEPEAATYIVCKFKEQSGQGSWFSVCFIPGSWSTGWCHPHLGIYRQPLPSYTSQ